MTRHKAAPFCWGKFAGRRSGAYEFSYPFPILYPFLSFNILLGSRVFSEALSEEGISHDFKEYEGDHWNQIDEQLMTDVLPFFSEKLTPGHH